MILALSMRFVVSVNHTLEIAYRGFPDGTKIDVYKHEKRDNKTPDNMKQVGEMEAAYPQ
jgi:hypothetical protein